MIIRNLTTFFLITTFIAACSIGDQQAPLTTKNTALLPLSSITQPLTLKADFSNPKNQIGTVYDFFDVAVRTEKASPESKPAAIGQSPKVNAVRMLGGLPSKDIAGDAYQWDGEKFVYHFEQVTKRIDLWIDNGWEVFQIVLDNPPWAFQRGLTFVEQPNGVNYLQKDAVGVYGNVLPPANANAWHKFIADLTLHLVNKYGKETVLKWRFRVGSEIDTRPQHWAGTRNEFFQHYQNTVDALQSVLPTAKVGAHFREASLKNNYVDYTGNTEDAYAPHFVTWAKANNIHYDFIAISYYPHITKPHELDMNEVYKHDIAPIQQHPDWNANASLEIHEFRLISKMLRAGFVSVSTPHASSFFAMLSKMILENNIKEIFQWGTGRNGSYIPELLTQNALYPMVGNHLFTNHVSGQPAILGNRIDGIFTQQANQSAYDILLFNFNATNNDYQASEKTQLSLTINAPAGTAFRYRIGNIDSNNNSTQMFLNDYPKANQLIANGGWRKPNVHNTASISTALNDVGNQVYLKNQNKYKISKEKMILWGEWQQGYTTGNDKKTSEITLISELPSFSVQKLEINVLP